jgi:hypothetical protein
LSVSSSCPLPSVLEPSLTLLRLNRFGFDEDNIENEARQNAVL